MLDGNLLQNQFSRTGDGMTLREIAWADLVARLKAARELRGEFVHAPGNDGGGFDKFAKLALQAENEGKRPVNRNALGASKVNDALADQTVVNTAERD